MSDMKNLLTETELRELLGGWRRHLNPFHNPLAAIKAATKHNLVLRKKAFWSIRQHGIDVTNIGFFITSLTISLVSATLALYLNSSIIFILSLTFLSGVCFLLGLQGARIDKALERPLFLPDSRSTGYPELDIILSLGSFEAEAKLAEGGLQADEIKKLAGFIEIVKQKNEIERQFEECLILITAKATIDMSSQTWGLVRRAKEIISGKVVPRSLASASPVINMLSVMEHAGIDIHALKTDMPLPAPLEGGT